MLYVTWQYECLLHCEHGCSVDITQLMQLITVGYLVMRDVGTTEVLDVILCLNNSLTRAVALVFLSHYFTSMCFCDHQLSME